MAYSVVVRGHTHETRARCVLWFSSDSRDDTERVGISFGSLHTIFGKNLKVHCINQHIIPRMLA